MQNRFERRAAADRAAVDAARASRQLPQRARRSNRPAGSGRRAAERFRAAELRAGDAEFRDQNVASNDWFDDFAAQRYSTFNSTPDYFYDYNYDDGYLYQLDRDDYFVTAMYPLLGGAFGIGQPLPIGYDIYNVPYGYRSLYYDTPDYSLPLRRRRRSTRSTATRS